MTVLMKLGHQIKDKIRTVILLMLMMHPLRQMTKKRHQRFLQEIRPSQRTRRIL
jgi:hypothetical protein